MSARCVDKFSPEDPHFWMAIKESKLVNWNHNYGNFQKHLEQLTPTETQENIAKEEIKKRVENNNTVRDAEVGTEKVIKRRKRKPIAPANIARLGSLRNRGLRAPVDYSRDVSADPLVDVDMGAMSQSSSKSTSNSPRELGFIWNGETWVDWLDAAQREESSSPTGSSTSKVTSRQTPSPVAEDVECVDGNDVNVSSSSSSSDDQAVVAKSGNGYASISNTSVSRQFSPSSSPEDRRIKFMQFEKQLSTSRADATRQIHGEESTVQLWEFTSNKLNPIQKISYHEQGGIVSMAASANSSQLLTLGRDERLCLWHWKNKTAPHSNANNGARFQTGRSQLDAIE